MSSPRTWGCFSSCPPRPFSDEVFPTHVGVFLMQGQRGLSTNCLPHARGGVSFYHSPRVSELGSSPRTWGCFSHRRWYGRRVFVFPTHVGVFPPAPPTSGAFIGLPHARGGVSHRRFGKSPCHASSPRTWGCFCSIQTKCLLSPVFPTHVGVFLDQFPCC